MSLAFEFAVTNAYILQTTSSLNIRTSTPKVVYPSVGRQMTQQRCCETGRPVMMDPVTGTAICSCQLKSGVPTYLSRVPSLPETVYGAAAGHQYPPNVVMGNDATSAFYQMVRISRYNCNPIHPQLNCFNVLGNYSETIINLDLLK